MENWKRVLFAGAAGVCAVQFLRGNRHAGLLAAGTGLAALAVEYPETVASLGEDWPRYLTRGALALNLISKFGNRYGNNAHG